jgi:ribosomal protein L11 methyltransferase
MAFGTGHHGTTQGCLRALDSLSDGSPPARIADIGCGTAVLAMAAARLWPEAQVIASDNDPVAVEVAEANLAANGLTGRVACRVAEGFGHPDLAAAAPFDLIVANILKAPLIALAPDMAAHCAPGGRLILSGLLTEQGDDVASHYSRHGFSLEKDEQIVDWLTLQFRKKP